MARASSKSAVKEKPKKPVEKVVETFADRCAFDADLIQGKLDRVPKPKRKGSNDNPAQLKLFSKKKGRFVIGVDEVGRGCLAGPVVAAAVVLPVFEESSSIAASLSRLDDSKKLSAQIREELSHSIQGCAHFAIAEASPEEIDEINIFHASLLAMKRAVKSLVSSAMLDLKQALILIDGKWTLPELEADQVSVIKGDSRSASIAAASVVAKVYRDSLMKQLATEFPPYMWCSNKGYPSEVHRQAIQEHGMTVWHRRSFRCLPDDNEDE